MASDDFSCIKLTMGVFEQYLVAVQDIAFISKCHSKMYGMIRE